MEHDSPALIRVRELVAPVASDLGLEIYDIEHRGGTLRVSIDTPPGSPRGVTMEDLALASRLVSRQLDEFDPMPGRYTLEVTSPGVERSLRTPEHFRRAVGKVVNVRLRDTVTDERRVNGTLVAADDDGVTLEVGADPRHLRYDQIDRARTVFEWSGAPKPTGAKRAARRSDAPASDPRPPSPEGAQPE